LAICVKEEKFYIGGMKSWKKGERFVPDPYLGKLFTFLIGRPGEPLYEPE
jgi:hypothetical protein